MRRASGTVIALIVACAVATLAAPGKGPTAKSTPRASSLYKAAPEVFWISIYLQGQKSGFGRGEYGKGEKAPFSYENLIVMNLPRATKVAERTTWEFDALLKPVSFFSKTIAWRGGQSVTNTVDGKFQYQRGKLACDYKEWGAQEKVEIPIPSQQIARYTQTLILAKANLKLGSRLKYRAYSLKDRRFVEQVIRVTGYDGTQKAWKLEATSEEAPGAITTLWFQTATPQHPNGYTLSSRMPGPDRQMIESRATTRAEAIKGFEKEAAALKI